MRNPVKYGAAALAVFFASIAAGACTYDFDTLVSQTGAGATGGAGPGGSSGSGGAGGTSSDGGEDDGTGAGGTAGSGGGTSGSGGTGGKAGTGGSGGTPTDAGKGGTSSDAAIDRTSDVRDATAETAPFDCAAVNGTVFQGHCYYPNPTETTWDVAKASGCAPPSHLAVIRSQAEQNVVAPMLNAKQRWIGLRKRANSPNMESSFEWVTQETLGSYKPWETYEAGTNEPNYTGECVRLQPTTNNWADAPCTETKPAICERE
ncbi:MAG: C-type lectin domain-containing protein [Polyangiaceae bacterium]